MRGAGHPVPDGLLVTDDGPSDRATGFRAGLGLLDRPAVERPTAVFCANDALGLGLLDAARERGLRIPDDLAVVGFDDVEGAALASPPLTTVRVHKEQLGEAALSVLAEFVSNADAPLPPATLIPTELVVRAST